MARPTPPPRELTYVPLARIGDDTTFRLRQPGDISSLARSIAQAGQLFPIDVRPQGDGFQAITGFRRLAALRLLVRDRVLVRIHPSIDDEAAALLAAADALDAEPLDRAALLEARERYRLMGWSTPAFEELIARALERAQQRLEDLAAELQGLPPPDRTVVDEDAIEEEQEPARATGTGSTAAGVAQPAGESLAPAASAASGAGAALAADLVQPAAESAARAAGIVPPPEEPPGPQPLGVPAPAAPEAPQALTAAELAEDAARRLSLLTQDLATLAAHWDAVPSHLRRIVADQIDYYRRLGEWIEQVGDEP